MRAAFFAGLVVAAWLGVHAVAQASVAPDGVPEPLQYARQHRITEYPDEHPIAPEPAETDSSHPDIAGTVRQALRHARTEVRVEDPPLPQAPECTTGASSCPPGGTTVEPAAEPVRPGNHPDVAELVADAIDRHREEYETSRIPVSAAQPAPLAESTVLPDRAETGASGGPAPQSDTSELPRNVQRSPKPVPDIAAEASPEAVVPTVFRPQREGTANTAVVEQTPDSGHHHEEPTQLPRPPNRDRLPAPVPAPSSLSAAGMPSGACVRAALAVRCELLCPVEPLSQRIEGAEGFRARGVVPEGPSVTPD